MAVSAVLIFPRIAPVRPGTDDNQWRVSDGGFVASGSGHNAAIISSAEFAQAELSGGEVIDTGLQIGEVPTNQIRLDLLKSPRTRPGADTNFPPPVPPSSPGRH